MASKANRPAKLTRLSVTKRQPSVAPRNELRDSDLDPGPGLLGVPDAVEPARRAKLTALAHLEAWGRVSPETSDRLEAIFQRYFYRAKPRSAVAYVDGVRSVQRAADVLMSEIQSHRPHLVLLTQLRFAETGLDGFIRGLTGSLSTLSQACSAVPEAEPKKRGPQSSKVTAIARKLADVWVNHTGKEWSINVTIAAARKGQAEFVFQGSKFVADVLTELDPSVQRGSIVHALKQIRSADKPTRGSPH